MINIITVHPLIELIINLSIHMTVHGSIHMESHCVLIDKFYPVSDTCIVSIELKSSILQVPMKFIIEY